MTTIEEIYSYMYLGNIYLKTALHKPLNIFFQIHVLISSEWVYGIELDAQSAVIKISGRLNTLP